MSTKKIKLICQEKSDLCLCFFRFLQHSVNTNISAGTDYRVVLLCNAYSTTQDYFTRPMGILIESVSGAQKVSEVEG